jgi:hypothetical protein
MTTSFIGLYGAAKALAFVFGPLVAGRSCSRRR